MLKLLITALNLAAALAGVTAAVYWYRSSRVEYPQTLGGMNFTQAVSVDTRPLLQALGENGRLNKAAAAWSAVAAICVALAAVIGILA